MFTHQYIDAKNSVKQSDELTDFIVDVETEPELSEEKLTAA